MRLEKMFPIYGGDLRLTLDIFNLLNTAYPLAVDPHFESEEFVLQRIFLHDANSVLASAIRFKYSDRMINFLSSLQILQSLCLNFAAD
jgi:hypothetical protein